MMNDHLSVLSISALFCIKSCSFRHPLGRLRALIQERLANSSRQSSFPQESFSVQGRSIHRQNKTYSIQDAEARPWNSGLLNKPGKPIETKRGNDMRYITALKVAALALGLGGAAITCQAQTPGGSYQQTCRDIGVRGSTLNATCKDEGGNWRNTQLSDYQRCNGEIQNLNGNLSCTGGNNGYGNNGNYGNNNGNNGDRRDDHHDADNRDRDHDGDRNGNYGNGYNGPRGSFSQTCSNIQVNGNTLQASCQKKNGKLKNTSLRNYQGCRDIENDNGKLRCAR
jgi:hypothetical protein